MTFAPPASGDKPFTKHYASATLAKTALHRARLARAAGVQTPAVLRLSSPTSLEFRFVAPVQAPSLTGMLDALRQLHRMPTAGFARFDPFRRILPRLGLATQPVGALVARLQMQDAARNWAATVVTHGDFHPGQVLCDSSGKVWLLDLDDLALAPPEADFGNLAAWMATQREGPVEAQAKAALGQVLAIEPEADPDLAWHFCQIALVRRALKLAGKGQPWSMLQLALRA